MRQILIKDNTVVSVVISKLRLKDYIENNDLKIVVGSTIIKDGTFAAPIFNLAEEKQKKILELNQNADNLREEFIKKYPKLEVESFPKKEKEANEYIVDNNAPVPFLSALVIGDRTKLQSLCEAILAKSNYSAQQEAYIVSIRDSIKSATTEDELNSISIDL